VATGLGSDLDIVVAFLVLAQAERVFLDVLYLCDRLPIFSPKAIIYYTIAQNIMLKMPRAVNLNEQLLIASMLDHPGLCAKIINTNPSAVASNSFGMTALHIAMASCETKICAILIYAGSVVNVKDAFDMSLLLGSNSLWQSESHPSTACERCKSIHQGRNRSLFCIRTGAQTRLAPWHIV
jgi:hypothetical protein